MMDKHIERLAYYVNDGLSGNDADCITIDGNITEWLDGRKPEPSDADLLSITDEMLADREKESMAIGVINSILGESMVEEFLSIMASTEPLPISTTVMANVKNRIKLKL